MSGQPPEPEKVTQEQALARIESVDGIPAIEGVAVPSYVVGDEDRARWSHAQRWARDSSGLPATDPLVQAMTRELFHNRAYAD